MLSHKLVSNARARSSGNNDVKDMELFLKKFKKRIVFN